MLVGYMRISTEGDRQVLDLQRDALLAAGVDERHLFEDRASGSRDDRTEPRRVSWRLQLLRGWSHDEANPTLFT
jgi:DNA invertase Pin-like site-specific DNA recombinase